MAKVPLHGGRANPFSPPQAAAVDAIQVLLKNGLTKGFAGPLPGQNPGQALATLAAAFQTPPFMGFHYQNRMA
jgi:hypothetical protein